MAENTKVEKKPIFVLRERVGGTSEELKNYIKSFNKIRKDIVTALKGGPKTVPEIAKAAGVEGKVAMWHIMAMRRYGMIAEGQRRGDYYEYALKEGV